MKQLTQSRENGKAVQEISDDNEVIVQCIIH